MAIVGVIGHVDHGKTTLVRALTGTDTDRLAEEKRRGISIELGFAHLTMDDGTDIDLVDMPGHERFVRTMVAGATGVAAILLVVAANDGLGRQTIEHVEIARLLGVGRAVAAISKADLVPAARVHSIAAEVSELLAASGFGAVVPIATSAPSGRGVPDIARALAAVVRGHPPAAGGGIAFLPIDRAFVAVGHGTVVTGTLRGNGVKPGDTLELLPEQRPVRVRGVQVHGRQVQAAAPGQRVALNLRGVAATELKRGMALAAPGELVPSTWLTVSLSATRDATPLRNAASVQVLVGTAELSARLRLLDCDVLKAGASSFAQLRLEQPLATPAGEHAVLRLPSPAGTVAGGRILDPLARRQRRHDSAVLARLADLRDLAPGALLAAEIARRRGGNEVRELARLCALPVARILSLLEALPVVVTRRGIVLRQRDLQPLIDRIPYMIAGEPLGLSRNQLVARIAGTPAALLDEALARLTASAALHRRGSQFVVPHPDDDLARRDDEARTAERIGETLRAAGLTPPLPAAVAVDLSTRRAVERLLRDGTLVRAVDAAKGRELLFHRAAIGQARERLAPLLGGAGLTVGEIAAALGISRKFAMPLLAHLDASRFTRRIGDRRVLHSAVRRNEAVAEADGNRTDHTLFARHRF